MACRGRALMAMVALAAMVAATALPHAAPHAQAQIVPDLKVLLDAGQDRHQASITDLTGTSVTFTGTVTLTRPVGVTPVTVYPRATVVGGGADWNTVPTPSKLTFNGTKGTQQFSMLITVPANLSAGALYSAVFNASAEGLLFYNTESANGIIEILQYFKLGEFSSTETLHVKQGDSRTFNFTVQNRGNGDDVVLISLNQEAELGLRGITVLYDKSKRLDAWQSVKVPFNVNVDLNAKAGDVKFNFTLRSQGSGERVSQSVDFSLVVDKALIKGFIFKYWWAVTVLVVVLVVVAAVVVRRGRARRADEEALAQLQYESAAKPPPPRSRHREGPDEGGGGPPGEEGDAHPAEAEGEPSGEESYEVRVGGR
jgi:hypothetical protein